MNLFGLTFQPDIAIMLIFAAALFWSLLWTSSCEKYQEFFQEGLGKKSIHRLLGAYLCVSYTVYAGYISLVTKSLPDFPYVVAGVIVCALGLVTVKDAFAIYKGKDLVPDPPSGEQK